MSDSSVLDVLQRADRAAVLPRLGGMARPDGVAIVTDTSWALAGVDGSVRTRELPRRRTLERIPLVRGLARLALALVPLLARGGSASRRERLLLLALLAAPAALSRLPHDLSVAGLIATSVALLAWVFRGRTLFLHGAEHRAIAAAESRSLVRAWNGEARPSRFSPRCGTNFAALAVPVTLGLERVWIAPAPLITPVLLPLCALAVTMEVWLAIQRLPDAAARVLLAPGLALQRLTTREPALAETRVALRAVAAVLERSGV
jgi:uncharacterized protein YqhQ